MAYKILKKEFIKKRPKWLVSFLFHLSPAVYNIHDSLTSAKRSIMNIKNTFENLHVTDKRPNLHLIVTDDILEIRYRNEQPIIRFNIVHNYLQAQP